MPHLRKQNAVQRAALGQSRLGKRVQLARAYDGYLSDFGVGDYGRVELVSSEQRAGARAAARRGLALRFRPGPCAALIFRVTPP